MQPPFTGEEMCEEILTQLYSLRVEKRQILENFTQFPEGVSGFLVKLIRCSLTECVELTHTVLSFFMKGV